MILAVHISDGVLTAPWLLAGWAVAAALVWLLSRGVEEDEIPRIGLLGAAFFVASSIHVRLGPSSVHLLLNGLLGLILGRRAAPAIGVGLVLQAQLLNHGGMSSLGVNACVMILPALLARPLFRRLTRPDSEPGGIFLPGSVAVGYLLDPLGAPVVWLVVESIRRLEWKSDFAAGWVIGFFTVMLTVFLNCLVLVVGGAEDWRLVAAVVFLGHLPVAVVEGFIVGSAVAYLAKAKPELLPRSDLREN